MKNKINIIITSLVLSSCASTDNFLIKNTGLSSKDYIALTMEAKNRMDANKVYTSGKDVVNPQPIDTGIIIETKAAPFSKSEPSVFDFIWNAIF